MPNLESLFNEIHGKSTYVKSTMLRKSSLIDLEYVFRVKLAHHIYYAETIK